MQIHQENKMNGSDSETTEVICRIVEARQASLGNIKRMKEQLATLESHLKGLEADYSTRTKAVSQITGDAIDKVWAVGTPSGFLRNLRAQQARIDTVYTRFERDRINIAVTGRHRTGKSQLLRAITGL